MPEQFHAVKVAFCVPQMLVMSGTICGATGFEPIDITMLFDTELVPQLLVQVAVYVPPPPWIGFCVLWIGFSVLPLLHVMVPEQPVAVNVAFCVPQMLVTSATICGAIGAVPLDI